MPIEILRDLVVANRILAHEGVVDAFGHVSVRHPGNPGRFFLSRARSPALITADDLLEFNLDGEAVDALHAGGPLIVLSRHAGPGDTIFLLDQLVSRFGRRPSIVFKQTLAIDPMQPQARVATRVPDRGATETNRRQRDRNMRGGRARAGADSGRVRQR